MGLGNLRSMWRRKAWAVVRREFASRVKTRWFVVSTLVAPVFLIGTLILPIALEEGSGPVRRIAVLDGGDLELGVTVEQQLLGTGRWYARRVEPRGGQVQGAAVDSLMQLIRTRVLDGVVLLDSSTIQSGAIEYRGRNAASLGDMRELRGALGKALLVERLRRAGVDRRVVSQAAASPELLAVHVATDGTTTASGEATFLVTYILAFALYVALFVYGQSVMRSVVEEKTTRIAEVLASSMPPEALMAGKVIGVGSVGLFQLAIWAVSGIAIYWLRGSLGGLFGLTHPKAVAFPVFPAGALLVLLAYFVLGYFLFSALYAGVGAMVTTEQEAQHAQMPVTFLLVPGLLLFPALLDDPASGLGVVMSLIPFSSPILMPVRWIVGSVPAVQLVASLALLVSATAGAIVIAARVYRVGILMYGKRASLTEVLRWIRYSG